MLTKQVKSGEKKIKENDKKASYLNLATSSSNPKRTFNIERPEPQEICPKALSRRSFSMLDIPKYSGITNPNEHVTSYTYTIKGNDLEDNEIESVLLKYFGESLSKGTMIWYHNLPTKYIYALVMLVDTFVKDHTGYIKVETRKSDLFKVKKTDNEMLRFSCQGFKWNVWT